MRIAQIMAGATHGGAELFYERMTLSLAAGGHDVLPVIRSAPQRLALLRQAGLKPETFRFGGPFDIFTKRAIARALRQQKTEIVIAWMSRAAAHLPRGSWKNIGRLGGYYDLKYFRSCDYLVGNTHGIVDYITAAGFPRERVTYLPNFVDDFAAYEPASREALGIPEDAPLLLGLGRLHSVKGFDTLIKAVAKLPGFYSVIAGEGPERAALMKLIAELGLTSRVKLLGWRADSGALLKTADLFVSSSRHEPLGNMVLEAFSAQTPVLAARAEGPSEVIRDGEDGVLVPIDDPEAMADAARTLLADTRLRIKLSLRARNRFLTEFSEPSVREIWLDYLSKVRG